MSDDSEDQPPFTYDYLAGFLDGEGCFTKDGRIHVSSTDHDLLLWLSAQFGGSVSVRKMPEHCAKAWQWNVPRKTCASLLPEVIPLLRTKRAVASVVLQLAEIPRLCPVADCAACALLRDHRDRLRAEVTRLNRRGA